MREKFGVRLSNIARVVVGTFLIAGAIGLFVGEQARATSFTTPDVLIVHSADWQTPDLLNWATLMDADPRFGTVTAFDARTNAFASSDLAGIEVVIVMTGWEFMDTDQVGDILADFVDQGGRVIETTYAFACSEDTSGPIGWGLGGRWEAEEYASILPTAPRGQNCADYLFNQTQTLNALAPTSPFLANVGAMSGVVQDLNLGIQAAPGATILAEWSNPANMPAVVVGSNCVMSFAVYIPDVVTTAKFNLTQRASVMTLFANLATGSCVASVGSTTTVPATTTVPVTNAPVLPATGSSGSDSHARLALVLLVAGTLIVVRTRRAS